MPFTTENIRNLDEQTLAVEIEDAELELSELEPQLAELEATLGKTADARTLFGLKLEIEELAERRQELTAALQVLTTERDKREQAD
jgi:hypothetical protein